MKAKTRANRQRAGRRKAASTKRAAKPRSQAKGVTSPVLRFAMMPTTLGTVLVAGSAKGIAAILLSDNPTRCVAELAELFPGAEFEAPAAAEEDAAAQVAAHVDDPSLPLKFRLDLEGTPFQVRVWNTVRKIPPGKTLTYGDVARKIGAPRAMRAVGSSCAKCRHLFAVPCHRVTAGGDPTGDSEIRSGLLRGRIRPGADRRAALLRREIGLLAR